MTSNRSGRLSLYEFAHSTYPRLKPGLSCRTLEEYVNSARLLQNWQGSPIPVKSLEEAMIRDFLHERASRCRPTTVNKDRRQLLAMWESAHEFGFHDRPPCRKLIRRIPEPQRLPLAWSVEEIERILCHCSAAPSVSGWDARHGQALILTMYDTAHRISALLQVRWDQIGARGFLVVTADQKKERRDSVHKLHPQTMAALDNLPRNSPLVFPWPCSRVTLWRHYGRILESAGLPAGPRDKFHRIRRTSYTYVCDRLGKDAAREHAVHSSDLSHIYCDPTKLTRQFGSDVLPRPHLSVPTSGR